MLRRRGLVYVYIGLFAAGCGRTAASQRGVQPTQGNACAPVDEVGRSLLTYIRTLVVATDTLPDERNATRIAYELPRLDPDSVTLVTDPAICSIAAAAYTSAVNEDHESANQRRVHVVRVGSRYVVEDPYTPARVGEWHVWAVFTDRWRLVTRVLS